MFANNITLHNFYEIVQYAYKNSITINNIARQYEASLLNNIAKEKIYDSSLNMAYNIKNEKYPTVVIYEPNQIEQQLYGMNIEQKLPYGMDVIIGSEYSKNTLHQNSVFQYDRATIYSELKIDLLQNFMGRLDKTILSESRIRQNITQFVKENAINNFLFEVSITTLNFLKHKELILLQGSRCSNLQNLHKINQKKFNDKIIDLQNYLQSKVQYQNCINTLQQLKSETPKLYNNIMMLIIAKDSEQEDHNIIINNISWPEIEYIPKNNNNIASNPSLRIAKFLVNANYKKYQQSLYRKMPELTLSTIAANKSQEYLQINDIHNYNHPSYEVALNLKIPFGTNKNKLHAQSHQAEYKLQQGEFLRLTKQLQLQYNNNISQFEQYSSLYTTKQEEIKLRKRIFAEKQKDFLVGRIDTNNIIDAQDKLSFAQQEILAIKYNISYLQLKSLVLNGEIKYWLERNER